MIQVPVQQLHAAPRAHGRTQGILMGGSYIGRSRPGRSFDARGNIHPIFVDRNRDDFATGAREDAPGQQIAWLFEPDRTSLFQQNARGYLQRLLRTGNHHNLVRLAADRPSGAEIGTNGFAKRRGSQRIDVMDGAQARAAAMTHHQV
jgi:hypothetical protein